MMHDVKFEAATPVHIGSGVLYTLFECNYLRENRQIVRFSLWDLGDALSREHLDEITKGILANRSISQMLSNNEMEKIERYRCPFLGVKELGPSDQIRECVKTANDLPYLPGSSIKGAIRTAILWKFAKNDDNFIEKIEKEVERSKNGKKGGVTVGKEYEESVFSIKQNGSFPNRDLLRFLSITDQMPESPEQVSIRLDEVKTYSLMTNGRLHEKSYSVYLESVKGTFSGRIGLSDQIRAVLRDRKEYPMLEQKLELLGLDGSLSSERMLEHIKKVLRDFNRQCINQEMRIINDEKSTLFKKLQKIKIGLENRNLIRIGFGVGTTYHTLFPLIEENNPRLAKKIIEKYDLRRVSNRVEDDRLVPPYPKSIEFTNERVNNTCEPRLLGWLEWLPSS